MRPSTISIPEGSVTGSAKPGRVVGYRIPTGWTPGRLEHPLCEPMAAALAG